MAKLDRQQRLDVPAIIAAIGRGCESQPRTYSAPVDIDNLVVTSVNVPFPSTIDPDTLAGAIEHGEIPEGYAGHVERFLGEIPVVNILRFCDFHERPPVTLAAFVAEHRSRLALRRPELEEYLKQIVPEFQQIVFATRRVSGSSQK
jgi:hypothetical protein